MRKLQRIFESTPEISFISPQTEFSLYWNSFLKSELGKICQAIPWKEVIKHLKLKEQRSGRSANYSPQGKLSLMFLKAYSRLSDRKLMEHLNGNIQYQLFCGIFLGPEKLPDFKIVSKILANHEKFKKEMDFTLLNPRYKVTAEEIRDNIINEYIKKPG